MSSKQQIQERIKFIEQELSSLDHFLPETYQYLMGELDIQYRELMTSRIQELYQEQQNEQ